MFNNYPEVSYQKLNKLLDKSLINPVIYERSWWLILGLYERNGLIKDYNIQFLPQTTDNLQIYWTLLELYCEVTPKYYILHYSQIKKYTSLEALIDQLMIYLK